MKKLNRIGLDKAIKLLTPDNSMEFEMETDNRKFELYSDYIGNDPEPYTFQQLFEYCSQCNADNKNDPDWIPFNLVDRGEYILDISHNKNEDGYIAAVQIGYEIKINQHGDIYVVKQKRRNTHTIVNLLKDILKLWDEHGLGDDPE